MDAERADPHDLRRFVEAQAGVYAQARDELAAGRKQSHWMWFVFPQLRGLGRSAMAHRYGIASRAEAVAYLDHPLLGTRLVECTGLMLAAPQRLTANAILGAPDDVKFHSSMSLFGAVAGESARFAGVSATSWPFAAALERFFDGSADVATLRLLDAR
jgi:uncharacterized protein (DUF1810 family)